MNWGLAPTTVSTFTSQHLDVLSRGHALHGVLRVEHGPRVPLHEGVVDVGVRAGDQNNIGRGDRLGRQVRDGFLYLSLCRQRGTQGS